MSKLHFSRQAEIDLTEIWEYVADDNMDAADTLVFRIREQARLIATHPEMGRKRVDLGSDLRSFSHGPYVLFYRPQDGGGISLIRVIHSRRDITPNLF